MNIPNAKEPVNGLIDVTDATDEILDLVESGALKRGSVLKKLNQIIFGAKKPNLKVLRDELVSSEEPVRHVAHAAGRDPIRLEKRDGKLHVDGQIVTLRLSEEQLKGASINGHEILQKYSGNVFLCETVFDALLNDRELIPEDWRGKTIPFFKAVYGGSMDGFLRVRTLCVDSEGNPSMCPLWLINNLNRTNPIAVLD